MYLVKEQDLKGVNEMEIQARMEIVEYLTEWAEDVFYEARERDSISLAGRYMRSRILEKGARLGRLLDAVAIVDLGDFWKAVDGYQGRRDDVILYGIFCMLFSEVNEDILLESVKLEGNIGYSPRQRIDVSERTMSEVKDVSEPSKKKVKRRKKKQEPRDEKLTAREFIEQHENNIEEEEEVLLLDEDIVEIDDKYVTPENVNKLTILAVSVIGILVVVMAWMLIF